MEDDETDEGFSTADREELEKLLTARVGDRACEMCGENKWAINPAPVSPLILKFGDGLINGLTADLATAHPSVLVHCLTCGNSKMFSLAILKFEPRGAGE